MRFCRSVRAELQARSHHGCLCSPSISRLACSMTPMPLRTMRSEPAFSKPEQVTTCDDAQAYSARHPPQCNVDLQADMK